jgi:hypothetical protein
MRQAVEASIGGMTLRELAAGEPVAAQERQTPQVRSV